MASIPSSATLRRHVAGWVASPLLQGRDTQRRWARVHDVRFLATQLTPDRRIIEKYRDKLDRKAKDEGLKSLDELRVAYKDKIERLKREASAIPGIPPTPTPTPTLLQPASSTPFPTQPPPPPTAQPQSSEATSSSRPTTAVSTPTKPPPGVKTLAYYLDLGKTVELPPEEISHIWCLRHANNPLSLCATIPLATYHHLAQTAKSHPSFILPLPRPSPEDAGAHEIHYLQWTFPSPTMSIVLLTHLAEFKLRGEYSVPHTTITHHLDIADSKDIVLMEGQVVEGRNVSVDDAQWLVMALQKFYGPQSEVGGGRRRRILEGFSRGEDGWRLEDVVEEVGKVD